MRVNIQQLAEIIGVARSTLAAWIDDGLPYVESGSKGRPWVFSTVDVLPWWAEHKSRRRAAAEVPEGAETYEEAERRKMIAQADKAELDLSKAARLVVPIEEVASIVAAENSRVRSRLLGIPNKVRMMVRSYFGSDRALEEEVVGAVESEILDAMTEIRDPAEMAEARPDEA
jgi:phage terminase Nu1 subunit (DNA packaging protein)